jgi:hypothetical protein
MSLRAACNLQEARLLRNAWGLERIGGLATRTAIVGQGERTYAATVFALLLMVFAAACQAPQFAECSVRCGDNGACPSDFTCGGDGYCYTEPLAGGTPLCSERDAGGDPGEDAGGDPEADARPLPDTAECHPLEQNCGEGQKCTATVESSDPLSIVTACVPDGSIAQGGACTFAAGGEGDDDCVAGNLCVLQSCRQFCDIYTSACDEGTACAVLRPFFEEFETVGVCLPSCDLIEQDCGVGQKNCYFEFSSAGGLCLAPVGDVDDKTQGATCTLTSGCARGYSCALVDSDSQQSSCAFICNPPGEGPIDCSATLADRADGPGEGYECRYLSGYYDEPRVPRHLGLCVGVDEEGSCDVDPDLPGCAPASDLDAAARES